MAGSVELLIGAGLLLAFCAAMGPVFCGWVCPLGLLLDLNHGVRERIRRLFGKRRRPALSRRLPSQIKYGVLGLVLGFSLTGHVPAFQTVSPINIVAWSAQEVIAAGRRAQAESVGGDWWEYLLSLGPALLLVFGIVVVEYVSPRLWCRCLCPLGAFYSLFGAVCLATGVDQSKRGWQNAVRAMYATLPDGDSGDGGLLLWAVRRRSIIRIARVAGLAWMHARGGF